MLDYWNRGNQQSLSAERQADDRSRVVAKYPTKTNCPAADCGWDEFTHSSKKADCTVCKGVGKLITWQTYYIRARVSWTAMLQFSFMVPTPGVELGDVILTIDQMNKGLLDTVYGDPEAYLIVDGKNVRPKTIQVIDVPHIGQEYQVVCNLWEPSTTG